MIKCARKVNKCFMMAQIMCIKGVHQISLEFNPHFIVWKLSNQLFFIMLTKVAGDFESAAFGRKVGVNPGMAGG